MTKVNVMISSKKYDGSRPQSAFIIRRPLRGHQACGIVVCVFAPPVVLPWAVPGVDSCSFMLTNALDANPARNNTHPYTLDNWVKQFV